MKKPKKHKTTIRRFGMKLTIESSKPMGIEEHLMMMRSLLQAVGFSTVGTLSYRDMVEVEHDE